MPDETRIATSARIRAFTLRWFGQDGHGVNAGPARIRRMSSSSTDPGLLAVDNVRSLSPYVPGKPIEELQRELGLTDIIKLASNENPFGPSPRALAAMQG